MINEPGNRRIILELIVLERFERSGIRYGGKVARIRLVRRAKPEVRRGKGFECLVVKRTTTVMQDVLLVRRSKTELRLRSVHFLLEEESCMICLGGERASELGIGDEKGRDGASYIEFFAKGRDNETRRDRFSYALGLRGVTRGGHVVLSPPRVGAGQDDPKRKKGGMVVAWSNYACALYSC